MTLTFPEKTRLSRGCVLGSYGLLLLSILFTKPLLALPLALFGWGVWRKDWRSHIWLCFILLFYFLLNINQLSQHPSWRLWFEDAMIVTLFTSAMFWCRWSKRIESTIELT